jgi:zinc protease
MGPVSRSLPLFRIEIMPFFSKLRPYLAVGLLLSLLLGNVPLIGGDRASADEPILTNVIETDITQAIPKTAPSVANSSMTQGVKKTILSNGLTVLTKEVHTAPVVSVQVWYRVGSRNEGPGINGLSHQLEHLLFKGTTDRPIQFGRLFSALGSQSNAFTGNDMTAYFGTVQRNKLEALLTLEADRMRNAINGPEQLKSEKRVVISELQGYENSPSRRLNDVVMRAAFPNRPYGLPVGGTKADVEKFTVEQVKQYYNTYYRPDNATLVVTGDFETPALLKQIQQIYGKISNPTEPLTTSPAKGLGSIPVAAQKVIKPIVLKQPGSAAILKIVFGLPDANHPDVPAIDLMDTILTGGRSSRLYQDLVETGLASSASAYAAEMIEPGWYEITATAAPGQPLEKIELAIQKSLTTLRNRPVTAEELQRAKSQLRASLILGNQDITSQATQLAYNQVVAGDYRFIDKYLAAIEKITSQDIQRVARTYLKPDQYTLGFFEPTSPDGKPGSTSGAEGRTTENFSPGAPVDPAEVAKYLPKIAASTAPANDTLPKDLTLANGLRVLLLPDRSAPTINLSGNIQAGTAYDSPVKAGIAKLTAENLTNGTQTKNALTLAKNLEDRGASLGFDAGREGVSISGNALAQDLPILVQTLADVLQHPVFPNQQLELSRQRALIGLKATLDDPGQLGRRVFQQAVYPENHPFHTFPTEESLKGITREDLALFHRQYYRPDTTVLAMVGDFNPDQVRSLLEQSLGQWQPAGKKPVLNFPTVAVPKATRYLSKTIPGKAESVTYLGVNGLSRKDPRYYAALVLNQVLGGDTLSSRLGTEIRDRQGLTYGIISFFAGGVYPGPFLITMQTAPNDAQKAIASTLALLKQIRETGITPAELENAKRSLTSSYPVDLANPSDLAGVILNNTVTGLDPKELRQFPAKIEAVTPAQIQQVIQDFIRPESLVVVTAGPGNEAKAQRN